MESTKTNADFAADAFRLHFIWTCIRTSATADMNAKNVVSSVRHSSDFTADQLFDHLQALDTSSKRIFSSISVAIAVVRLSALVTYA